MKCFGVFAVVVLLFAAPAFANAFAEYYSHVGTATVYVNSVPNSSPTLADIADAVALPGDDKYVKITGSGFSLILKFPIPALWPKLFVHFAGSPISENFMVREYTDYPDSPSYWQEDSSASGTYEVGINSMAQINYVEITEKQGTSAGPVYIDAIEALNGRPVVDAGPDLTIRPEDQAATTIQGTITDSDEYPAVYEWLMDDVKVTGVYPFPEPPGGPVPLDLSTLGPLEEGTYEFRLHAYDNGIHVSDTMILTVSSANAPPAALDDSAKTDPGILVEINVLANDSDPDGDDLSIDSFTQGANGSVVANGDLLIYTPSVTFVGTDTFTYTATDGKGGTATATVTVTVRLLIDIKPGSYPNSINLGSNGVVPVAILSTADFDATAIPANRVFLAGAGVAVRGKGKNTLASNEDINGDGLLDLVLKVETENLDPGTFQDGYAILKVHETEDQTSPVLYEGWDEITIVPPQ